jgi:hypothetical protein
MNRVGITYIRSFQSVFIAFSRLIYMSAELDRISFNYTGQNKLRIMIYRLFILQQITIYFITTIKYKSLTVAQPPKQNEKHPF